MPYTLHRKPRQVDFEVRSLDRESGDLITLYTVTFEAPTTAQILEMRPLVASLSAISVRYATALKRFSLGAEENEPQYPDLTELETALKDCLAPLVCDFGGIEDEEGNPIKVDSDTVELALGEWETDMLVAAANALVASRSLPKSVGND